MKRYSRRNPVPAQVNFTAALDFKDFMCSVVNEVHENPVYKTYHKRMGQKYGGPLLHPFLKLGTLHYRNTDKYSFGMVLK